MFHGTIPFHYFRLKMTIKIKRRPQEKHRVKTFLLEAIPNFNNSDPLNFFRCLYEIQSMKK